MRAMSCRTAGPPAESPTLSIASEGGGGLPVAVASPLEPGELCKRRVLSYKPDNKAGPLEL